MRSIIFLNGIQIVKAVVLHSMLPGEELLASISAILFLIGLLPVLSQCFFFLLLQHVSCWKGVSSVDQLIYSLSLFFSSIHCSNKHICPFRFFPLPDVLKLSYYLLQSFVLFTLCVLSFSQQKCTLRILLCKVSQSTFEVEKSILSL